MLITWSLWFALKKPNLQRRFHRFVVGKTRYLDQLQYTLETNKVLFMLHLLIPYSLLWSLCISTTLAREKEAKRYSILSMIPAGTLGINWFISSSCLHRNAFFARINNLRLWSVRIIILAYVTLPFFNFQSSIFLNADSIIAAAILLTLVAAVYIDYTHTFVQSVLLGIVLPTYFTRQFDVRLWTIMLWLTLQIIVYTITIILGFVVLEEIYTLLNFTGIIAALSIVTIRFLLFYGFRTIVNRVLWHLVLTRLPANQEEFFHLVS